MILLMIFKVFLILRIYSGLAKSDCKLVMHSVQRIGAQH
nr:Dihydropteroate synthase [Escherichia coli O25b:H4-ST131]